MTVPRVGRKSFARRYGERTRLLLTLARELPGRPTADQIHDLRVTARRIQVMRRLIPGELRSTPESKRFGAALKSVLRGTSQLRDIDTLMLTLKAHGRDLPPDALVDLGNQRSDAAARSKVASKVLAEAPPPELDPYSVSGRKLSRKLGRRLSRQSASVVALLPKVVTDEANISELHTLRKEVKKLRYLLELDEKTPRELPTLTKWQDSLGAIHDLDVAMAYLEDRGIGPGARVVSGLKKERHLAYRKFVNEYRNDSDSLGDDRIMAAGVATRRSES
jgi:CHAD domain-containing protein